MTLPMRRLFASCSGGLVRVTLAQLYERIGGAGGAQAVGQHVDVLGVGVRGDLLDEVGQVMRRGARALDVTLVDEKVRPRRPREADHHPAPGTAVHQLGQQFHGDVKLREESVDVDVDFVVRGDRQLLVDRVPEWRGIGEFR